MINQRTILILIGIVFLAIGFLVIVIGTLPLCTNAKPTFLDQFMAIITASSFTSGLTIFGLGVTSLAIADTKK
jgi:hypothetical protein